MTNLEELKAVLTALGGDPTELAAGATNADVIAAIAAAIPGALAGVLPAVTADNNGSVLKVADGKWAIGTDAT